MLENSAPNRLTFNRENEFPQNDGNVTTLIAEPVYGTAIDELPSYELFETNLTADAFTAIEKQFGHKSPIKMQNITSGLTDFLSDPSSYTPLALWGGSYFSGNAVSIVSNGLKVIEPRINLSLVHTLLFSNPWHYACVDAKASASTQLGYDIVSTRKMQKGVSNSEVSRFIAFEERVFRKTGCSLSEIFRQISQDYFSIGNMCLEIVYQWGGEVDCVYPVSATTCLKHVDLPLIIQRSYPVEFSFTTFGERIAVMPRFMSELDPDEYRHLVPEEHRSEVGFHEMVMEGNNVISTDPYYGTADILSSLPTLLGDNAADTYNLQFFRNNAIPRYAITIEGGRVTEEVANKIKRFLSTEIKGNAHRAIVIPLNRGFKATFTKLDASPNEASFLAYKNMNRETICTIHKVPPAEIGLMEDANRSNSEQQSKNYLLKVIAPHQTRLASIMNNILGYGFGMSGVQFKWREIELTSEREIATIKQINAAARSAEALAIRNIIEATVKAKEAMVIDETSANKTVNDLLKRFTKLLSDSDKSEFINIQDA